MRVAFLLLGLSAAMSAHADDPPSVLLIVADDLRADVMSVYGGPVPTPHLARLAARGCLFERATCGYPICHVSRTELLSGRVVVAEAAAGKAVPFSEDWTLWPQHFRQAGWHTVNAGKWHMHGTPRTRGYAETAALFSSGGASGQPLTHPISATGRKVTGYTGWTFKTNDNRPQLDFGVGLTPTTDIRIADCAIEALERHAGRPLFLHVNFTAPHDPLHWPPGWENRDRADTTALPPNFRPEHPFDHGNHGGRDEVIVAAPRSDADVQRERAVYFAVVEHLDAQIGRILETVERLGLTQRTLVIVTSDQGLALGSHGLMGKQNQYEHTANVPLILAGPGVPGDRKIAAQCALRDLYPTACELVGVPIPESVQGRSLLPVLRGKQVEVHDAIYGYFTDTQRMIRTTDGWKLIWYPRIGRTQLFHVATDPHELTDLANEPEHRARQERLMVSLKDWLKVHRDVTSP